MAYKHILLDNDGTLMDFVMAQEKALENVYKASPLSAILPWSPYILECYDKANKAWWAKLERGECNKAELQLGRFYDFFELIGLLGDAEEFNTNYMTELGKGQYLIEGALDVVKALSEKYPLYITTNGVAKTQHNRIDTCEFAPFITKLYVSEETGFAKPKKEYFDYVMNDIGDTDPAHYIIVGDSLASDIKGARNAGIDSIWYNPEGLDNPENIPVTHEIKDIKELLTILL